MTTADYRKTLFRDLDDDGEAKVMPIELFFDLVFVFAITQLSHYLLDHLSVKAAVETLVMTLAVWWVWINTSWATNWLDPDRRLVRLMMIALMLAGLILSSAIPQAFLDNALPFALAYTGMQVGRTWFMLWASNDVDEVKQANFRRSMVWTLVATAFWIGGAMLRHDAQLLLWSVAIAIEYAAPAVGYWVPVLGRTPTRDWNVAGGHVAERCGLFVIIALGEALLVTGASYATALQTDEVVIGFVVAFASTAVMWWLYFDVGAKRGSDHIERAEDTGRIARIAYTYLHLLIVGGIVLTAVADAMVMKKPRYPADWPFAAVAIGGTVLFLIGTMAFKRETSRMDWFPLSHRLGIGLLLACLAAVPFVTRYGLLAMTVVVLVVVAILEMRAFHANPELAEADPTA